MADPPTTTQTNTIRTLDTTRHRLLQLTNALSSLHRDLTISDPLPTPLTLQKTSQLLAHHLTALSTFLSDPSTLETLARTNVYPLPTNGGRAGFAWADGAKEAILTQLVRKKVEPGVEGWVDEGRNTATSLSRINGGTSDEEIVLKAEELEELWKWAKPRAGELAAGVPWGIDYSIAEKEEGVEKVVTGIRRTLNTGDEDESGSDEDEDDDEDDGDAEEYGKGDTMEGFLKTGKSEAKEREKVKEKQKNENMMNKPMVLLEELLRFAGTGTPIRTASMSGRPMVGGNGMTMR